MAYIRLGSKRKSTMIVELSLTCYLGPGALDPIEDSLLESYGRTKRTRPNNGMFCFGQVNLFTI